MDTMELRRAPRLVKREQGVAVTEEDLRGFLENLAASGRTPETLRRYRQELERMAQALPGDGMIRRGTLEQYRDMLLSEGYAPRTVNIRISAANSYVAYMGHVEYQLRDTLEAEKAVAPELTRGEYIHLLQTAQLLQRERVYLLVKLFANADLPVQELPKITLEAAQMGQAVIGEGKSRRIVRLPRCLCRELVDYAGRSGIKEGPLFLTRDRTPMDRTSVTSSIRELCAAAKIPVEKGSPRCLRRLYLAGRKAIEDNIAMLVEQALERQTEEEQLSVAWETA